MHDDTFMPAVPTVSQTVGPFFEIGLTHLRTDAIFATPSWEPVSIRGAVFDGDGRPVPDVVLEIWQADADGRYDVDGSSGFGRIFPDAAGTFCFQTVQPGSVRDGVGTQAPHLVVMLFMRGLLKPLRTRMYFPDHPANASDTVLGLVPPERRSTLIARQVTESPATLEWNVHLQGDDETAFFAW